MILLDINVMLDVIQKREPYYFASARVIDCVVRKQVEGALSAHAFTTLDYLVANSQGLTKSRQVVDWLLIRFSVAPIGREELMRAKSLAWSDFEDAVTAAAAEALSCQAIITRNIRDFSQSPVPALAPEEWLAS